jgi:ribonuclease HI
MLTTIQPLLYPESHLLGAGPEVLAMYADASFSDEIRIGCWAYSVPSFPLLKHGFEPGGCINRLELAAVVHALADTAALDRSQRAYHIHTDSEFVVGIMQHISRRERIPERQSYIRMADLYQQACDTIAGRTVTVTRRARGDLHHKVCDDQARHELRRYCSRKEFARTILIKRAEAQRKGIISQIRALERSLALVEKMLSDCDSEYGAVPSGATGSQRTATPLSPKTDEGTASEHYIAGTLGGHTRRIPEGHADRCHVVHPVRGDAR